MAQTGDTHSKTSATCCGSSASPARTASTTASRSPARSGSSRSPAGHRLADRPVLIRRWTGRPISASRPGRSTTPVAWILLTFLACSACTACTWASGLTGILYLLTVGLFGLGYLYDYWTLTGRSTS